MSDSKSDRLPLWFAAPVSVFSWFLASFFTVFSFVLGFVTLLPLSLILTPKTRYWAHQVAVFWAKSIVFTSPFWSVKVQGRENIDPQKRYVVIANHQSMLDILVCLAGLPAPFKFLAKKELFVIPFVGWQMGLAGYIPLDRSSRESGRQATFKAKDWLSRGVSVLFYPEGTRSPDGQIQNFKMGAFKIAAEEGLEILPLVIDGTGDAIPKKSWKLEKILHFKLSVGKPVSTAGKNANELANLKESIREDMIQRLKELRS